jgi:hypothetical protein
MVATLFPELATKEQLIASMNNFILYGGWTCLIAIPIGYTTLPDQHVYYLVTFLTTFYIIVTWIYVFCILCKYVANYREIASPE